MSFAAHGSAVAVNRQGARRMRLPPASRFQRSRQCEPCHISALSDFSLPRFDAGALKWACDRLVDVRGDLEAGLKVLPAVVAHWDPNPLIRYFSLDRPSHCFAVEPYRWSNFHEPQITGGFSHFINDAWPVDQIERARAFVQAAYICAGRDWGRFAGIEIRQVTANAELAVTGSDSRRRVDILVELELADGSWVGTLIEAKFGSKVRPGQLEAYRDYARAHARSRDDLVLLVVAATTGNLGLENDSEGWLEVGWIRFLHAFELCLAPENDDQDFCRFRRTVWEMA